MRLAMFLSGDGLEDATEDEFEAIIYEHVSP